MPKPGERVRVLEVQPGTRVELLPGDMLTVKHAAPSYAQDRSEWGKWIYVQSKTRNGYVRVEPCK